MKQILCRILLLAIVIAAIFGLSSCKIFVEQEPSTYDLIVNNFERSVVYGSELDLSGLDIEVTTEGEVKHVAVTKDMITSGGKTDSVGDHEMIIEYGGLSWSLYYEVFYKIDHIVDGSLYDSQLVMSREEYMPVKNPEKNGAVFLNWSEKVPDVLTGNLRIEAIFAEGLTLPEFTATYGDTLADLDIPEAKDGHWEWKLDPSTSVGNAGTNKFQIVFVPDNPAAEKLELTTTITVAKKKLEFTIFNGTYVYDGKPHGVEYQLSDGVKPEDLDNVVCFGTEYATEIGYYNYNLRIYDANYEGQIKGSFEIVPIKLNVSILLEDPDDAGHKDAVTIKYGESFPEYKVNILGADGKAYDISGTNLNIVVYKPDMLVAGRYEIIAKLVDSTNDGFNDLQYYDVTYSIATLTVDKQDFDPGEVMFAENYVIYYGDALSSVKFAEHPNGEWAWDYEYSGGDTVGNAGKNTFKAVFTPKDSSYNTYTAFVVLDVNKQVLEFVIDHASTNVDYDGKEHCLSYVVVDKNGKVMTGLTVTGNDKYTLANQDPKENYTITLKILDDNYTASANNVFYLHINKIDPVTDFETPLNVVWTPDITLGNIALPGDNYTWVTPANTKIAEAGIYKFKAKYTPDDTINYNIIEADMTVVVSLATTDISGVEPSYDEWTYNGNEKSLQELFKNLSVSGLNRKVEYHLNGEKVEKLTNAGIYNIKIVVFATNQYAEATFDVVVTIKRANAEVSGLGIVGWTYLEYDNSKNTPYSTANYGTVIYEYKLNSEDDSAYTETVPTEAGKYTLRARIEGGEGYNWNASEYKYYQFTVAKSIVALPTISSKVYTGATLTADVDPHDLYEVKEGGNLGGTNVGNYPVVLVLNDADNYVWSNNAETGETSLTFVITQADNAIATFAGGSWVYGDTVSHTGITSTFGTDKITVKYYKDLGDGKRGDEVKVVTDAGNYIARAEVSGTDNYKGAFLEVPFTVAKLKIAIPELLKTSYEYTGERITAEVVDPETKYYSVNNNGGIGKNTYYVHLDLKNVNYMWEDGDENLRKSLEYSITKSLITIDKVTISDWKFGQSASVPSVTKDKTFGEVRYEYKPAGQPDTAYTTTVPTLAGDYVVRATVLDTANYDGTKATATFTIEKANASILGVNANLLYTEVYNSKAYSIKGVSSSHRESAPVYTIKNELGETVNEMKNAGTYKVVITLAESANYNAAEPIEVTVVIDKFTVMVPELVSYSRAYNGENFEPAVKNNGYLSYFGYSYPTDDHKNAGDYAVTFTLNDPNYKWDDDGFTGYIPYKIAKADAVITVTTASFEKVYRTAGYTIDDIVSGISANHSESEIVYSINNFGDVDVYAVTVSLAESANYNAAENKTVIINITKDTVYADDVADLIYNGANQIPVVEDTDLYYVYENNGAENVGEHEVVLKLRDSKNYKWSDASGDMTTVSYNITPATITLSSLSTATFKYLDAVTFTSTKSYNVDNKTDFGTVRYVYSTTADFRETVVPSNVGTYYVKAVVDADSQGNWGYAETLPVSFKIDQKEIYVPTLSWTSKVYANGSVLVPDVIDPNTDINIEDEIYTVAFENVNSFDADSYDVVITLTNANFKWNDAYTGNVRTRTYSITQLPVHELSVIGSYTYNATEQEVNLGEVPSYITDISGNAATNAGSYTAILTLDNNHMWAEGSDGRVEWSIGKGQVSITVDTSDINKIYGDNTWTLPVATANLGIGNVTPDKTLADLENAGSYVVTYTVAGTSNYEGDTKTVNVNIDKQSILKPYISGANSFEYANNAILAPTIVEPDTENYDKYSFTNAGNKNVGTYTVTFTIKNEFAKNYKWETGDERTFSVTYDITRVDEEITNLYIEGWSYVLGTIGKNAPDADKKFDDSVIIYEYKLVSEDDSKYTTTVPTNVGNYVVRATIIGGEGYNWNGDVSEPFEFSITQATPAISGNTSAITKKYDNIAVSAPVITINGVSITPVVTYKAFGAESYGPANDGIIRDAGEYDITYSYTDPDGNYSDRTVVVKVTINKITNNDNITGLKSTYSYLLSTVSLPEGWTWEAVTTNPNTTVGDVGTNEFWAVFTPDDIVNYATRRELLSVAVSHFELTKPSGGYVQWTGETENAGITNINGILPTDGVYELVDAGGIDEGDYTATITITNLNYKWRGEAVTTLTIEVEYYIAKQINSWKTEPTLDKNVWVWDEGYANINIGEADHGTVTYKFAPEGTTDYTTTAPTVPGKYVIVFTATAEGYKDLVKSIPFEIKKITLAALGFVDNTLDYANGIAPELVLKDNANVDKFIFTNNVETTVGSYEIVFTIKSEYKDYYQWNDSDPDSISLPYSIVPAKEAITNLDIKEWIYGEYDEDKNVPDADKKFDDSVIIYEYKLASEDDSKYTTTVPTAVGDYILRARIEDGDNWIGTSETKPFSITEAQAIISINTEGKDYLVKNEDGTYTLTLTYTGEVFNLKTLIGATKVGENALVYSKSEAENVSDSGDITLSVADSHNYIGISVTVHVVINPMSITDARVDLGNSLTYNGDYQDQYVSSVTLGGKTLTITTDYTVSGDTSVKDVKADGSYTITVTGTGNYTGTKSANFNVAPLNIGTATVTLGDPLTYNGEEQTQTIESVKLGDLVVTYDTNNVQGNKATYVVDENGNTKTYTITVTGTGNFKGTATKTFEVLPMSISGATVTISNSLTYNGDYQDQSATVVVNGTTLTLGTDYTVSGDTSVKDVKASGKYTIVATGTGNYTGTKSIDFNVAPLDITNAIVKRGAALTYTGAKQYQTVDSVVINGITLTINDYKVENNAAIDAVYENGEIKEYTLKVIATSANFTGEASLEFTVGKADYDMSGVSWTYSEPFTYAGPNTAYTVTLKGTLPEGVGIDKYKNNEKINAGDYTATVTFTYNLNYNEPTVAPCKWTISPAQVEVPEITLPDWEYGQTASEPNSKPTFGEPEYQYLVEGEWVTEKPTTPGTYYVRVVVADDTEGNYDGTTTEGVQFIIEKANETATTTVKENTNVTLTKDETTSKTTLTGLTYTKNTTYDITDYVDVALTHNTLESSARAISDITVDRADGVATFGRSALTLSGAGSYKVTITYAESPTHAELKVVIYVDIAKADYDMTGIQWNADPEYNGKTQTMTLTSASIAKLESQCITVSYTGNTGKDVQSYTANVIFAYDEDNYNAPDFASTHTWNITTLYIDVPEQGTASHTYIGGTITFFDKTGDYWKADGDKTGENVNAETAPYVVTIKLTDPNCAWKNVAEGKETADIVYEYHITKGTNEIYGTLTMDNWTYDGVASTPNGITGAKWGTVQYQYRDVTNNGTWGAISAPTSTSNVGKYAVRAYVEGTGNYDIYYSDAVEFVISPAEITAPEINKSQIYVVGGDNYPTLLDGTVLTEGNHGDYTVTYNFSGTLNVGQRYTVTVYMNVSDDVKSNYVWAGTNDNSNLNLDYTLTGQKATIEVDETNGIPGWTFGSKPTAEAYTASIKALTTVYINNVGDVDQSGVSISLVYYDTNDKNAMPRGSMPTDAGTYYFKIVVAAGADYEETISESFYQFTIEQATPEYTVPTGLTATYGDTLANVTLPAGWSWNDSTADVGNVGGNNEFDVTFTPEDTKNYKTITVKVPVTVSAKSITLVTNATDGVITSKSYNENGYKLSDVFTFQFKDGNTAITSFVLGTDYEIKVNGTAVTDLDSVCFTNASTYTITVTLLNGNYTTVSTTSFTFEVKTISLTLGGAVTNGEQVAYNSESYHNKTAANLAGSAYFLIGETQLKDSEGNIIRPSVTIKYSATLNGTYTDESSITKVGYYKIIYSYTTDNGNYTMSDDTRILEVIKVDPGVTVWPTYTGLTYKNLIDKTKISNTGSAAVEGTFTLSDPDFTKNPGYATFTVTFTPGEDYAVNYASDTETISVALTAVARYGDTEYYTIKDALDVANESGGDVWVYPDVTGNVIIDTDIRIASGVTLILPYGKYDGTNDGSADIKNQSYEATMTESAAIPSMNDSANKRKTLVKVTGVDTVITIDKGGILEISGQLSGKSSGNTYAGYTAGLYAELQLGDGVVIDCRGTISCYGYITETTKNGGSRIEIRNGAVLHQPFTLLDFGGGSYMYAVYKEMSTYHVSPFNEFVFMNVHPKVIYHYGGKLEAWANLYAGDKHNPTLTYMIGTTSSYCLQMPSGGNIASKYDVDTMVTDLDIYGGITLNKMSITIDTGIPLIGKTTISTEDVYFPISWAYDISLNRTETQIEQEDTAIFTVNQMIQLMTGAKLVVEEGAHLVVNGDLHVHDKYVTDQNSAQQYYGDGSDISKQPAMLLVRGSITAKTLAGRVYSDVDGAKVSVTNSITSVVYRVQSVSGSSIMADATIHQVNELSLSFGYLDEEGNLLYVTNRTKTLSTTAPMYTHNGNWRHPDAITINYNSNGGNNPNTVVSAKYDPTTGRYTIISDATRDHYVFNGWYDGDILINGDLHAPSSDGITLEAHWTAIEYTVKFEYWYQSEGSALGADGKESITVTYTMDQYTDGEIDLTPPENGTKVFAGWYNNSNCATANQIILKNVLTLDDIRDNRYSTLQEDGTHLIHCLYSDVAYTVIYQDQSGNEIGSAIVAKISANQYNWQMFEEEYLDNKYSDKYISYWSYNGQKVDTFGDITIADGTTEFVVTATFATKEYTVNVSVNNGLSGNSVINYSTTIYLTEDQISDDVVSEFADIANSKNRDTLTSKYFTGWNVPLAVESFGDSKTLDLFATWADKMVFNIIYGGYGNDILKFQNTTWYLSPDGNDIIAIEDVDIYNFLGADNAGQGYNKYFAEWQLQNVTFDYDKSSNTAVVNYNGLDGSAASVTAVWRSKINITINHYIDGVLDRTETVWVNIALYEWYYDSKFDVGNSDTSVPIFFAGWNELKNMGTNGNVINIVPVYEGGIMQAPTADTFAINAMWETKYELEINGSMSVIGTDEKTYEIVIATGKIYLTADQLADVTLMNSLIGGLDTDVRKYDSRTAVSKYFSNWKIGTSENTIANLSEITASHFTNKVLTLTPQWNNKTKVSVDYGDNGINNLGFANPNDVYVIPGETYEFVFDDVKAGDNIITNSLYYNGWASTNTSSMETNENSVIITLDESGKDVVISTQWATKSVEFYVQYYNTTVTITFDGQEYECGSWNGSSTVTYYFKSSPATIKYRIKFNSKNNAYYGFTDKNTSISQSNRGQFNKSNSDTVSEQSHVIDSSKSKTLKLCVTCDTSVCLAAGTIVLLADGTTKKIEDVLPTDVLLVFDHETGKFVESEIMLIETHGGWDYYNIINATFSNGTTARIINEHGFFDKTLNRYVYIRPDNYADYIGHEFVVTDGNIITTTTLVNVTITNEYTGLYNIVTKYHLNCITDGLLSMSGGIEGIFNIFEYGEDLKYDEEQMQKDIEEYGLYTYEDFAEYVSEDVYNMFPAQYFKVAVGKGHITYEGILALVEEYLVKHGYVNPDSFQ